MVHKKNSTFSIESICWILDSKILMQLFYICRKYNVGVGLKIKWKYFAFYFICNNIGCDQLLCKVFTCGKIFTTAPKFFQITHGISYLFRKNISFPSCERIHNIADYKNLLNSQVVSNMQNYLPHHEKIIVFVRDLRLCFAPTIEAEKCCTAILWHQI